MMELDVPLHVFEANLRQEYLNLGLAVGVLLLGAVSLLVLWKKGSTYENRNHHNLYQLLSAFAVTIAFGTTCITAWTVSRIQDIRVYADRIETGYGVVALEEINAVFLHQGMKQSFLSPNITTKQTEFLYVEERKGRAYLFAETNYELLPIIEVLRPMVEQARK